MDVVEFGHSDKPHTWEAWHDTQEVFWAEYPGLRGGTCGEMADDTIYDANS